ncbi:hypothetical protein TCAL_11063 [Tigriopus californicus]|uniref:Uncharacterized protein n=1 Tax=Tigriopus californicus TaxID=6832 RepID=A0A553PLG5_TIGCA|nr:uncharacterized protein LOC131890746 [Tigriopus californicus]TRY78502.1 hypothetical protein TCAL_11063 [Tigriopus californicus]
MYWNQLSFLLLRHECQFHNKEFYYYPWMVMDSPASPEINDYIQSRLQCLIEGTKHESPLAVPDHPPPWLDQDQFLRGRALFYEYKMGILMSSFRSLVVGLSIPNLAIPLCLTKRSSTPAKAFKRYLHTGGMVEEIYKIIPWESTHVLDTINRYHRLAAQKIRAMSKEQRDTLALLQFQDLPQHPYALSSTDRGLLEVLQTMDYPSTHLGRELFREYRHTHVVFSDTDMALVHLAFFATFVQHPISYGGGGIGEQDLDAFLHYWRVIGYYLGVKDDLNLAGGGSQSELCAVWRALSKQLLYPYLQILDGVSLKMVKALTTANDLNLGLIMFSSMEVNGNELSELWNKFPVHTKFLYYWRRFFMECLYRTRYFRITINWLLSTVTTRLLEKLGPYSPLETDV